MASGTAPDVVSLEVRLSAAKQQLLSRAGLSHALILSGPVDSESGDSSVAAAAAAAVVVADNAKEQEPDLAALLAAMRVAVLDGDQVKELMALEGEGTHALHSRLVGATSLLSSEGETSLEIQARASLCEVLWQKQSALVHSCTEAAAMLAGSGTHTAAIVEQSGAWHDSLRYLNGQIAVLRR